MPAWRRCGRARRLRLPVGEIRARHGAEGLQNYAPVYGRVGAVTDDTQMTLFTAEGLLRAHVRFVGRGICHVPSVVHREGGPSRRFRRVGSTRWSCAKSSRSSETTLPRCARDTSTPSRTRASSRGGENGLRCARPCLSRTARTHNAVPGWMQHGRNGDTELIGETHQGAQRQILHAEFDALKVVGRHAELLRELVLRESTFRPEFGDFPPDVLDD
jgi:ADP-ribosylglycohydrolase